MYGGLGTGKNATLIKHLTDVVFVLCMISLPEVLELNVFVVVPQ